MMTEIQPQVNNEQYIKIHSQFNPLNAELNLICHLLALLGAHHILHVNRIRVNGHFINPKVMPPTIIKTRCRPTTPTTPLEYPAYCIVARQV